MNVECMTKIRGYNIREELKINKGPVVVDNNR